MAGKDGMNVFSVFATLGIKTDDYDTGLDNALGKAQSFGGSALSVLGNVSKGAVGLLGKIGTVALDAATDFAGYALNVGMDFEAQMSKVGAITGETGAKLEKTIETLSELAKEQGRETVFTATQAGEAMEYMAMAGWKTGEITAGLPGILDLAAASGVDLARTSDIVTDALTAFGLSAGDSSHFADVLAAASSAANTNVDLMGETFKYVAPVAGALGFSIEDTATAIGVLADSGIKGSQAGTTLRQMLNRLSKATEETVSRAGKYTEVLELTSDDINALRTDTEGFTNAEVKQRKALAEAATHMESLQGKVNAMQKAALVAKDDISELDAMLGYLGVTTSDSEGNMRDLDDILQDLRVSMNGLSEADQTYAASVLGGQVAMAGVLTLMNSTEEGYNKVAKAVNNATGRAEEMADTMTHNLRGSLTLAKSAAESFALEMIDSVSSPLTEMVQLGTDSINQLTDAFKTGGVEGMVEASHDILTNIIDYFMGALPDIANTGTELIITLLEGVISNLPLVGEAAVNIIHLLIDNMVSLNNMIIDTGWEILLTLLEGLTAALPDWIRASVDIVIHLVDTLTSPDSIDRIITAALDITIALVEGLIEAIPKLTRATFRIISSLIEYLTNPESLEKILETAFQLVMELGYGLITAIPQLISAAFELGESIVDTITNIDWWDLGSKVVTGILDGIKNGWSAITNFVSSGFDKLVGWGKNLLFGDDDDTSSATSNPYGSRYSNIDTSKRRTNTSDTSQQVIHTTVTLNGREIAEAVSDPLRDVTRQRGTPAYGY